MALKDWEKQRDVENLVVTWTSQTDRGSLVDVFNKGKGIWTTTVMSGNTVIVMKIFKSKSKAMAFARAYMRTN